MDTREEVAFDPEKVERVDPGKYGKYNYVRSEYYDRLLAANREQKAEIERLKALLKSSEDWRTAYQDGKYKLYAMGGDICDAAAEHLPCGEGNLDRQTRKAVGRPEIRSEIVRAEKAEAELASLRASAGEKPEDAWKRAGEAITERFMKQCRYNNEQAILTRSDSTRDWHTRLANMYGSIADELKARPTVYVDPPTLPTEEK